MSSNLMPLDKGPGPDGIPAEYYVRFWPTMKTDFVQVLL